METWKAWLASINTPMHELKKNAEKRPLKCDSFTNANFSANGGETQELSLPVPAHLSVKNTTLLSYQNLKRTLAAFAPGWKRVNFIAEVWLSLSSLAAVTWCLACRVYHKD